MGVAREAVRNLAAIGGRGVVCAYFIAGSACGPSRSGGCVTLEREIAQPDSCGPTSDSIPKPPRWGTDKIL
eukprot:scaffold103379_cov54-Phaeocystis_antarctica.AAC.1